MRSLIAASVIVCGVVLLSTASSDEPKVVDAEVKGVVVLNGKPLAAGRVFFHLKDGQFVGSRVKQDGKFAIDRVPTGEYSVTIEGEHVPKKYSEERVAVLKVEVRSGMNEFQLDLQAN